jgi:hypothetical protein
VVRKILESLSVILANRCVVAQSGVTLLGTKAGTPSRRTLKVQPRRAQGRNPIVTPLTNPLFDAQRPERVHLRGMPGGNCKMHLRAPEHRLCR